MKDVVRSSFVVLATAALLLILWWFRVALVSFFVAVMISAALAPAFKWFEDHRVPRGLAVGLVYGLLGIAAAAVCLLLYQYALRDLNRITDDLKEAHAHVHEHWTDGNAFQRYLASALPSRGEPLAAVTENQEGAATNRLLVVGSTLTRWSILAFLVLVVSIYWSMDYERLERLWLLLLKSDRRVKAREIWRQIQSQVGAYLRGELIQGLLVGLIIGITFKLLGFPYSIVLAVLIAGTWLVPWMGAVLAILAVWGASLLNFMDVTPVAGLARGLIGSGITLLVFATLKFAVEPRLIERKTHSSLFLIVITVGSVQAIGVIGVVVGPVISRAIQVLVRSLLFPSSEQHRQSDRSDFEELDRRLGALNVRVGELDPDRRLPLENMLRRLEQLTGQAKNRLE